MEGITIEIIRKSELLPPLNEENFFHSAELFRITEQVPGSSPFMAVAMKDGRPIAHLLAVVRRRIIWQPFVLLKQGRIYGEGVYHDTDKDAPAQEDYGTVPQEELFGLMLKALTRRLVHSLCFFVEVSDISRKMFGYREFRRYGYFPLHWQEIHNSLHSKSPEERIDVKLKDRIAKSYANGIITREVASIDEGCRFYRLLKGFYRLKLRRLIPPEKQFVELYKNKRATILVTLYKNKIIGGSVCVFSEGNAYLWYLASKRKTYHSLHPNTMTVWYALRYAHAHNYAHMYFMDVGLPWKRNAFREFILSFGGKPVGTYRWFRFTIPWVNKILSWWYRD